jgi:pimeloyl-ACP methyl ester carboxylesterase
VFLLDRAGVRLACRDFGGQGPAVLLLHGLAGHAGEWDTTAGELARRYRVAGFDQRGHGSSERRPPDVSREAHVADVAFAIAELGLAPVVLIGQSLGGHLAMLVAARHPELLRGLVVAEANPNGGDQDAVSEAVATLGASLRRWPVPFASHETAVEYFGGPPLKAKAWVAGLEQRGGGLWPRFEVEVMERTLGEALSRSYWDEWRRIRCPTLIVRAQNGILGVADARAMADALPHARLAEVRDAGHDLHLERPGDWHGVVTGFLDSLGRATPPG